MKIKFLPEDFFVEEVISVPFSEKPEWPYILFRLEKVEYNTWYFLKIVKDRFFPEAVDTREVFQVAGLKDKRARTVQYVTISRKFVEKRWRRNIERLKRRPFELIKKGRMGKLTFLGYVPSPMGADKIIGNRFIVTLRGLKESDINNLPLVIEDVETSGFPNYYDEQRFYHITSSNDFVAKLILKRHFMGALKLFFVKYQEDIGETIRVDPSIVMKNWKNWELLKRYFNGIVASIILEILSENEKPEYALEVVSSRVMDFHFMKYQAYIWNLLLNKLFRNLHLDGKEVRVANLNLLLPNSFPYGQIKINLLHKRWLDDISGNELDDVIYKSKEEVLREENIDGVSFNIKGYRGTFFKRFPREVWVKPSIVDYGEAEVDETEPASYRYTFSFVLPPGSYATMMIKAIEKRLGG